MVDFQLVDCGSICILNARSEAGEAWIAEHIPADALTWGPGVAIEPRYVGDILDGIAGDGLTVEKDRGGC